MIKNKTDSALSLLNMIILMQHLISKPEINIYYIDLFCGAGGTSTGVELARINGKQIANIIACVNHDKNAIASHMANHPLALHFTEDIRTLNLAPLVSIVKKIRNKNPQAIIVLWASLECTNFSNAKGGLPRDADSRTLAEHLHRYIQALEPDYIQIENVEEFMSWGDLNDKGKPISRDKGRLYREWVDKVKYDYGRHTNNIPYQNYDKWYESMRKSGSIKQKYDFDYRILNAADYGAYTSRKRFFGQFAKEGLPIAWPKPTHSKTGENTLFGEIKKWNPVKDKLDLLDEGTSIFTRKKPLSEKTLERIYAGLIKFVAGGKDMFLSKYYSGHPDSKNISVDGPAHTIKCKDNHSLISTKFLAAYYGNGDNVSTIDKPCPTISTKDRFSYVNPKFMCSYNFNDAGKSINQPAPTILTKDRLSLVAPQFIQNYYSSGGQHSDINMPCSSILAIPKQRVVSCKFIDQQFGQSKPTGVEQPLGSITANPKYNLVNCKPWVMNTNFSNIGTSINEPAQTITANRKWHYLMNPQYTSAGGDINKPCFTLIARMDKMPPYLICTKEGNIGIEIYESDSPMTRKIKEFMAIYGIIDIKMRMLRIPELKRIMGFPENYVLFGTQTEQKKYIGNAVEVNMAKAICEATSKILIEMKRIKLSVAA